eukprot:2570348-Pyramimonas_sp.AAC.1
MCVPASIGNTKRSMRKSSALGDWGGDLGGGAQAWLAPEPELAWGVCRCRHRRSRTPQKMMKRTMR